MEENASEAEDKGVADECLSGESCDGSTFFDFDDNECESKGLDSTCEGEDEWELTATELVVDKQDDN